MNDVYDTLTRYGVRFNGDQSIPDHEAIAERPDYTLSELKAAGGRVCRVRIFRECGMMDLSSAHGVVNGEMVRITQLPHIFCPTRHFKGQLISWAKDEGVFAKGIGLLDEGNWSVLG
jgi:hypothetical protein